MTDRKIRRLAIVQARKIARKTGFSTPQSTTTTATAAVDAPEHTVSEAQLNANRLNAQNSTGPKSAATKSVSSQNHATHGLARHITGTFRLLASEDENGFEALRQCLLDEHQPETPTEAILVQGMVESYWLAERAKLFQDTCFNPENGDIFDEKKLSLYMRYQASHKRAFHKSLNDLLKLRAEKRKAAIGFEAQQTQQEARKIQTECHEMRKELHLADVMKRNGHAGYKIPVPNIQEVMNAAGKVANMAKTKAQAA